MSRVAKDVLKKLADFLDNLPSNVRGKCALCNETLTHIVKQAETQTGAPMATVTKAIADSHNETAASMDKVSGSVLQDRVRRNEGKKVKLAIRHNKPDPQEDFEEPQEDFEEQEPISEQA